MVTKSLTLLPPRSGIYVPFPWITQQSTATLIRLGHKRPYRFLHVSSWIFEIPPEKSNPQSAVFERNPDRGYVWALWPIVPIEPSIWVILAHVPGLWVNKSSDDSSLQLLNQPSLHVFPAEATDNHRANIIQPHCALFKSLIHRIHKHNKMVYTAKFGVIYYKHR